MRPLWLLAGYGGVMTVPPETTDSSPSTQPSKTPTGMSAETIRSNVLKLWDDNDAWIPGADYARLAKALDLPPERLLTYRSGGESTPSRRH